MTKQLESQPDTPADSAEQGLFDREWNVAWHHHLVPVALSLLLCVLWLLTSREGSIALWAVSWPAVADGRVLTIALHMFAHGGFIHLAMNIAALLAISGPLISRLGPAPVSWLRYLYLFFGSGLAGAALFLASNQAMLMLGSSGAVFGLLGALTRVHPRTGDAIPIRSARTPQLLKFFLHNHIVLLGIALIGAVFTGGFQFFAWEAHLGGLLFGFFVAPVFLNRPANKPAS